MVYIKFKGLSILHHAPTAPEFRDGARILGGEAAIPIDADVRVAYVI